MCLCCWIHIIHLFYLVTKWCFSAHDLVYVLWFLKCMKQRGRNRHTDCTIWGLYKCLSDSHWHRLYSSNPPWMTENNPKPTKRQDISLTAISSVSEQQMQFGEHVADCLTFKSREVPKQKNRGRGSVGLFGTRPSGLFWPVFQRSNVWLSYRNYFSRTNLFIEICVLSLCPKQARMVEDVLCLFQRAQI